MPRLQAMLDELVALEEIAGDPRGFSIEGFSGEHWRQLETLQAFRVEPRVLLMMARQVAKSWTLCGGIIDRAISRPNTVSLYFGLNGVAVRKGFWSRLAVWQRVLGRYSIECHHVETTMTTTFPNGSIAYFTGTDDITHIKNVLGMRLPDSFIAIDECQSQKPQVLKEMLTEILPPTLTPTSTLVLAGTIPRAPGGVWWKEAEKKSWFQRSWGRVCIIDMATKSRLVDPKEQAKAIEENRAEILPENPHTPEAPAVLVKHMADNQLTIEDPTIQQDWLANRKAFDPKARGYFYRPEVNMYKPVTPDWLADLKAEMVRLKMPPNVMASVPWPGIDRFSVAIDPGGGDPWGLQVCGWGKGNRHIQHLFDWTSEWNSRLTWADVMATGKFIAIHFPRAYWFYDTNSDAELNAFDRDYKVPAIRPAKKADKPGQIRRTNDSLKDGTIQVMEGSSLETDYLSATLDEEKLSNGQYDWTDDYHPTASECVRYLMGPWWEMFVPPAAPKPPKTPYQQFEAAQAARMANPGRRGIKLSRPGGNRTPFS